jgi:hypothetical protein
MGILYILANVILLAFAATVLSFFIIPVVILGSYTVLINHIPLYDKYGIR